MSGARAIPPELIQALRQIAAATEDLTPDQLAALLTPAELVDAREYAIGAARWLFRLDVRLGEILDEEAADA